MTLGVSLSFLSTRTDMPGSRMLGLLAILPILVPPFILVVGWVALADPSAGLINIAASSLMGERTVAVDINTMPGLIWMTGLFLTPYVYLLIAAGFRSSDAAMDSTGVMPDPAATRPWWVPGSISGVNDPAGGPTSTSSPDACNVH